MSVFVGKRKAPKRGVEVTQVEKHACGVELRNAGTIGADVDAYTTIAAGSFTPTHHVVA